ncbi:amidase [Ovoidimarina sediminis]|uniref:amidase n=1 Tax=Ovoidimarina sediminis TaxID=3079856 RepID=UPI0029106E24|nr:amidase [Rhodophyticola sp. MJ-SS7]MDU8943798.1 amidase [Rhodophyticola sp. MJ-SS7]
MEDWRHMTAADLGRGIAAGEIDPLELTETYLAACEVHDLTDRIYARLTPDRARAEAAAARDRARAGLRRGPLDGVPISWKDLYDTAGVATEAGTALLKGRVPDADARVLRNATQAGLVCLGKTHTTELAFSGLGYNPITATPPSVNDLEAVSGGSSSGAATSVAFGLAAAGIGSDTGGSVRVPSAWNDLVGLKTAHGDLSLEGVVPLCPKFDTVGPLCRSVEDAGLLFSALGGGAATDLGGASLKGARFLSLLNGMEDTEGTPLAAFQSAVERLEAAGAVIEKRALRSVAEAMPLSAVLFATEAYGTWSAEIEANPGVMFEGVRERFRGGAQHSGSDYVAAWQRLDRLRAAYLEETAGYDAVILPSCVIMPPKIADLERDIDYFNARNLLALQNTRVGNLMGLAALTLPTGTPSTGIMLCVAPDATRHLLRIGRAAEDALS